MGEIAQVERGQIGDDAEDNQQGHEKQLSQDEASANG